MKMLISVLLFTVPVTSFAGNLGSGSLDNADVLDLASKASVNVPCASEILSQTTRECNAESKAREQGDREHECFYSYDLSGVEDGILNITFTTGDADEWNYSVYLNHEAASSSCDFTIRSQN